MISDNVVVSRLAMDIRFVYIYFDEIKRRLSPMHVFPTQVFRFDKLYLQFLKWDAYQALFLKKRLVYCDPPKWAKPRHKKR
jgi:hypothetical protein